MRVARNWRRGRSLAVKSSSPTSFARPPVGVSDPFCNRPITVSDVTDLPEPLSPTRQSVSRSATRKETPSRIFGAWASLPSVTARFWMSRMVSVMWHRHSGMARRTRPGISRSRVLASRALGLRHCFVASLLAMTSFALALFHAGIERVAGGIADQIDAEDRDRQQQARPKDQGRLDLKILTALGHDVAPGRCLRA